VDGGSDALELEGWGAEEEEARMPRSRRVWLRMGEACEARRVKAARVLMLRTGRWYVRRRGGSTEVCECVILVQKPAKRILKEASVT